MAYKESFGDVSGAHEIYEQLAKHLGPELAKKRKADLLRKNRLETRFFVGYRPGSVSEFKKTKKGPVVKEVLSEGHILLQKNSRQILQVFLNCLLSGSMEDSQFIDEAMTLPINFALLIREDEIAFDESDEKKRVVALIFFDRERTSYIAFRIDKAGALLPYVSVDNKENQSFIVSGAFNYHYRAPSTEIKTDVVLGYDDFAHLALGPSFDIKAVTEWPNNYHKLVMSKFEYDRLRGFLVGPEYPAHAEVLCIQIMQALKEANSSTTQYFESEEHSVISWVRSMPGENILTTFNQAVYERSFKETGKNWYALNVVSALLSPSTY